MPRVVKSPVERWAGTITLYEPLDIEQVMAIEDALDALAEKDTKSSAYFKKIRDNEAEITWTSRDDKLFIPVIWMCVEKWELQDFPADRFPATPRNDSSQLVRFLWSKLLNIYSGEVEVPNE